MVKNINGMKRIFAALVLLVLSYGFAAAQTNGYGGNGNNNASPYANAWSPRWPNIVIHWLQNGGQVPPLLTLAVLNEARPWFQQNFGLGPLQVLQKYAQGLVTITYVPTTPPADVLTFRVGYGGIEVIAIVEGL